VDGAASIGDGEEISPLRPPLRPAATSPDARLLVTDGLSELIKTSERGPSALFRASFEPPPGPVAATSAVPVVASATPARAKARPNRSKMLVKNVMASLSKAPGENGAAGRVKTV
jgi:hypothetical protein